MFGYRDCCKVLARFGFVIDRIDINCWRLRTMVGDGVCKFKFTGKPSTTNKTAAVRIERPLIWMPNLSSRATLAFNKTKLWVCVPNSWQLRAVQFRFFLEPVNLLTGFIGVTCTCCTLLHPRAILVVPMLTAN